MGHNTVSDEVILSIPAPSCISVIAWRSGPKSWWWVGWIVLLRGTQFSDFFRCLQCISMRGGSTLIFILLASGISRMLASHHFGGLCLVCLVIGSLAQTWGGQFSFYWALRISLALSIISKWTVASSWVIPSVGEYLSVWYVNDSLLNCFFISLLLAVIDRNCDLLPLCLGDLLNHTT